MHQLVLAAALFTTLAMTARRAEACACCDGTLDREPIAWTATGDRLLVRMESHIACERSVALEVWKVGAEAPASCYDLLGDPNAAVPCDALKHDYDKPEGSSNQLAAFSVPVQSVAPATLRFGLERLEEHAGAVRPVRLRLGLVGSDGVAMLAELDANEYYYSPPSGEEAQLLPLEAAVLPAPGGRDAALLFTGDDLNPGIGLRGATIRWLALPRPTRLVAGVAKLAATVGPLDMKETFTPPEPAAEPAPPAPLQVAVVEPKNRATGCGCALAPAPTTGWAALVLAALFVARRALCCRR
jgi:hypothetical protein